MKLALRITLLAFVAAGGIWLGRVLFPGDEVIIRRQIEELAEVASFAANEAPLAKVANAEKVAGFFAVDGEIDVAPWGYPRVTLGGRDELREAARGARFGLTSLTVSVEAITIVLGPGDNQATASLTLTGRTAGSPERQSQAMELEFRKVDGDWLIRRARTVEYLRP